MVTHDADPLVGRRLRRVTINDIAARAGVSAAAVSYALNDRPGVGPQTRDKIKQIATVMGWRPNHAARSLQAARTHAVGFVMQRPTSPHDELAGFMQRLLDGLNSRLSEHDEMLLLHTVHDVESEMSVYQRWYAEHRVDAAVVVNPTVDDARLPLLERLGLPCVIVGDTRGVSPIPAVWTDDADATELAVAHLAGLGHRRIAWIGGQPTMLHSSIRQGAFSKAMSIRGLRDDLMFDPAGEAATDALLADLVGRRRPPTAMIFEHDIAALRALNQLRLLGLSVPADVSVMSWDDHPVCRLTNPTLTALRRDAFDYGQVVGGHLLALLAGDPVGDLCGTKSATIARQSTGPVPARRGAALEAGAG